MSGQYMAINTRIPGFPRFLVAHLHARKGCLLDYVRMTDQARFAVNRGFDRSVPPIDPSQVALNVIQTIENISRPSSEAFVPMAS